MASPEHIFPKRRQIDVARGNAGQDRAGKPPNETEKAGEQRGTEAQPHPDDTEH